MPGAILHPIGVGWVSTGGTGAQNYDEFASDGELAEVIAAHPTSLLGVEMPHRTPEAASAGLDFSAALPVAADRLRGLKDEGYLRRVEDVVAAYRISGQGEAALGVLAMVDTDQISSSPDQPGRVIRNEDVAAGTVAERIALLRTLRHLTSPVLLVQADDGPDLATVVGAALELLGAPVVSDTDQAGRRHDIWLLPPGPERDRILATAGAGRLIVADGNHRTLAAQEAGLDRFLAVVTSPRSVHIQPYNRLVSRLPIAEDRLLDRLRSAGAAVTPTDPGTAPAPGTAVLRLPAGRAYAVVLPRVEGDVVDRLDHSIVERMLLGTVLGLGPADPAVRYVGGDYPAEWLAGEVDAGRAAAAILIAPVAVHDFVEVNLQRLKMPRKSTWFTPKARAGLVVAELPG